MNVVHGEGLLIAGKYRLIRQLGVGGMGTVYEARHELIGRRVAIKFLNLDLAGMSDALARFRREAQVAGSIESENVVAVADYGVEADGTPYIVMEYLSGEDLADLLARSGPLPAARAVEVILQACRGLDSAHAAGVVHRDLKPENLMICRRGDGTDLVKVLDFGIAKLRGQGVLPFATQTGATLGTPFYMSPEQARGEKDLDARADVYALGVVLYEALSGAKPHPGDSYNAILYHILSQPPRPLESVRAGLPTGLAEVVERAIAYDAHHRHQSVGELAQALAPFAERAVTPFRSQIALVAATGGAHDAGLAFSEDTFLAAPERASAPPSTRTAKAAPARRSLSQIALSLSGVALLLGAGFALHWRSTHASAPASAPAMSSSSSDSPNRAPGSVAQPSTSELPAPNPSAELATAATVSHASMPSAVPASVRRERSRTVANTPPAASTGTAPPSPSASASSRLEPAADSTLISAKHGSRAVTFDATNPYQK